jgi:hypothetical protein
MVCMICNGWRADRAVVSHNQAQVILSDNIVMFGYERRPSPSCVRANLTMTGPVRVQDLDKAVPVRKPPFPQTSAELAKDERASENARDVATIYIRAARASGFGRKLLPDGTMTIEQIGRPNFVELDQCVRELSELGVGPVSMAVGGAEHVLDRISSRRRKCPSGNKLSHLNRLEAIASVVR